MYADWLEERGDSERAEYVRAQEALLEATDLAVYDDRARQIAILGAALDPAWRTQLDCPAIRARLVGRRLGWLGFGLAAPRPPKAPWELPAQLRYLERLAPTRPAQPLAILPMGRRRWWMG